MRGKIFKKFQENFTRSLKDQPLIFPRIWEFEQSHRKTCQLLSFDELLRNIDSGFQSPLIWHI